MVGGWVVWDRGDGDDFIEGRLPPAFVEGELGQAIAVKEFD